MTGDRNTPPPGAALPRPPLPLTQDGDLHYFLTSPYACSYLAGQTARSLVIHPARSTQQLRPVHFNELVQAGFRRSGNIIYRPQCESCQSCQSLRLPVARFVPDRSQKRAWRRHTGLLACIHRPHFDPEHFALYQRYQSARHATDVHGRPEAPASSGVYRDFLVSSPVPTWLVSFHEGPPSRDATPDDPVVMVSIIDLVSDGLSAVYTFYEPREHTSYGTWAILWQIGQAREMGLAHVYLGYWVDGCTRMAYKTRFAPHEIYRGGQWQPPAPEGVAPD
ncbi:arginyltransferase [Amphibiibacter pelophylacis]|uniref:Arginyltransferase n=1 Tax=Amphibiibacter pelophylacis TaxID=1799477 RepID=A0ACC6P3B2_9BURK